MRIGASLRYTRLLLLVLLLSASTHASGAVQSSRRSIVIKSLCNMTNPPPGRINAANAGGQSEFSLMVIFNEAVTDPTIYWNNEILAEPTPYDDSDPNTAAGTTWVTTVRPDLIQSPGVAQISADEPGSATTASISNPSETLVKPFYVLPRRNADFNGDKQTDLSFWRPGDASWNILESTSGLLYAVPFGVSQDIPVPGFYDNDNKTDIAVARPVNQSLVWYIRESTTGGFRTVQFGISTDIPAPADYDGDLTTDIAVYRPGNGTWYILGSRDGYRAVVFGAAGDKPVPADYDADGKADIAVYRPGNGTWYRLNSRDGAFFTVQFGVGGDIPVPADYDGDMKADIAVYRPGNSTWYWLNSGKNDALYVTALGVPGNKPVPGDYDGDGTTDIAVFDPDFGYWSIIESTTGALRTSRFGAPDVVPVPRAYFPN